MSGSAQPVPVARAGLILTTSNDTRQRFDGRTELTRRHCDSRFAQLRDAAQRIADRIDELSEG